MTDSMSASFWYVYCGCELCILEALLVDASHFLLSPRSTHIPPPNTVKIKVRPQHAGRQG